MLFIKGAFSGARAIDPRWVQWSADLAYHRY